MLIIDIIFALIMLAIVLGYLRYVRQQSQQASSSQNHTSHYKRLLPEEDSKAQKVDYRCVVIKTGQQTCAKVRELAGKPILLDEAPLLPLTECDVARCNCKFTRHEDRRMNDRRTFFGAAKEIMENHRENRKRTDRRKSNRQ